MRSLTLYSKRILSNPRFYISAYLERNRDEYNERLLAISRDGNWNGCISFIPKESAKRILRELKNARVLEVLRERQGRKPAVYVFPQLIAISEGGRL